MLSRKDYKAIAEIIANNNTKEIVSARLVCLDIAHELQKYFAADNPRCEKTNTGFDCEHFLKACGL